MLWEAILGAPCLIIPNGAAIGQSGLTSQARVTAILAGQPPAS